MSSTYVHDQIAKKYGGWARLCDPEFTPSDEIYVEFDSAGMKKEEFDEIRNLQCMPMRERLILDVAEELLTTWMRYLCGYEHGHEHVRRNVTVRRFIDMPVASFWNAHQNTLIEQQVTLEEIESFIQTEVDELVQGRSPYGITRVRRINNMAGLCRTYPPPDSGFSTFDLPPPGSGGPDVDPSLVPRRPCPITGSSSIALPLPQSDDDDSSAGRNCA